MEKKKTKKKSSTRSITEKWFFSNGLEVLASVCAYALDRELYYNDEEPYQVLYLVNALKYADTVLNIPKKMRSPDRRRRRRFPPTQPQQDPAMAMITADDYCDLLVSDLQPKKRRRFDDFLDHGDYQKLRLSEHRRLGVAEDFEENRKIKNSSNTSGSKRRRFEIDEDYEGKIQIQKFGNSTGSKRHRFKIEEDYEEKIQIKKPGKCNTTGLKRRRLKFDQEDYEKKLQSKKSGTTTGIHLHLSGLLPLKKRRLFDEEDDHKNRKIIQSNKSSGTTAPPPVLNDQNEERKTNQRIRNNNGSGKRQKMIVAGPNPPPEMSAVLKQKIVEEFGEFSDLRLVIQKSLFPTDVTTGQNRLSIPLGQIAGDDFLTDEEKRKLESRKEDDNNHSEGIEIYFFEPNLEFKKSKMTLKKWNYGSSSSYMLSEHWYNVAIRNGLEKEDVVQIWFFRRREGNNPCIALVNLSQRNDASSSSSSSTVVDHQNGESDQSIRSDVTA